MSEGPSLLPEGADLVAYLNDHAGGYVRAMGLRFTRIDEDEVVCEVPVGPHLEQPYGIVHGGVYSTIAETCASVGAGVWALRRGRTVVGLENSTSFIRAVRSGVLHGVGRPLHRGRATHVWDIVITDDEGRTAATGRVRMMCLDPGATIAGETVEIRG
ncbi:MAG: PaaI family thioesterase [Nannocystaceae bacterium]